MRVWAYETARTGNESRPLGHLSHCTPLMDNSYMFTVVLRACSRY